MAFVHNGLCPLLKGNDASNLITRTNPNGTQVTFTYDGLNRVKTKTLSTGMWTYNYDAGTNGKGRMVSVVKGTEGYFYDGYDAMGRLTQSHQVTNAGDQHGDESNHVDGLRL